MSHAHRSFAVVACVSAIVGMAPVAAADDDGVDDLLRQGVALRRLHRDIEALAVFQAALTRSPKGSTQAQVALAEQALGRWLAAERDLDAALGDAADPWIAKNEAILKGARTVIEGHLGWLTVGVDLSGASITVAGEPAANGVETRVLAGDVAVDVQSEGRVSAHRVVPVAPSQHAVVAIALEPLPPAAPASPRIDRATKAPPPPTHDAIPRGALVLGGLGLVAFATGAYFGIRTIDFKSERDGACTNGCLPAASGYDLSARSSATASTVAFGVGAGFVAAGIGWWLFGGSRGDAKRPAVEVAPMVGVGTGGVLLRGAL